tara:strand:+ start:286 stop:444 length:159 start_codon:yes stop_codon:yes gene_type:complete
MRAANISISIICLSLVAGTNARADLLNSIGRFETNPANVNTDLEMTQYRSAL